MSASAVSGWERRPVSWGQAGCGSWRRLRGVRRTRSVGAVERAMTRSRGRWAVRAGRGGVVSAQRGWGDGERVVGVEVGSEGEEEEAVDLEEGIEGAEVEVVDLEVEEEDIEKNTITKNLN